MITQKHGRKLASQLGEVLFVCQFYDLQIVKKISLSLRNLWLHLVCVCVCVCVSFLSTNALHYFKVSLLQCNYAFKYGVILINYMCYQCYQ